MIRYDRRVTATGSSYSVNPWENDVALVASAACAGTRVINLSGAAFDTAQMNRRDTAAVRWVAGLLTSTIRRLNEGGNRALYVFSAGNQGDQRSAGEVI